MTTMTTGGKPGFLGLFIGGFALGAATLVGVQSVQVEQPSFVAAAHATTR